MSSRGAVFFRLDADATFGNAVSIDLLYLVVS